MNAVATTESINLTGNLGEKTFQLLEQSNLLWTVKEEPLYTGKGIRTESFGIIRLDTEKWLGTVTNKYRAYQNSALAETLIKAAEGIGDRFRGGYIGNGEKVFLQVALNDEYVADDTIKRHLTALNSHDGSSAVGFGSSNTVVVCQNTFLRAHKDLTKFRHGLRTADRIKIAAEELRLALVKDEKLMESYKIMAEKKMDTRIFARIVKVLFNEDLDADTTTKDISKHKENRMKQFNEVVESEVASHGSSLWGLFNAVTYFQNHIATKPENKLNFTMFGEGFNKMNKSYDEIMYFIDQNTVKPVAVSK